MKIKQGFEPPNFTGFFGVWDNDLWNVSAGELVVLRSGGIVIVVVVVIVAVVVEVVVGGGDGGLYS